MRKEEERRRGEGEQERREIIQGYNIWKAGLQYPRGGATVPERRGYSTWEAGAIFRPAATPLWKLAQAVMLAGTSMFPLLRSTMVLLGGARPVRHTSSLTSLLDTPPC